MANRRFPEVDALIRRVEDKAAEVPDRLIAAIAIVHMANRETDPYLLIGGSGEKVTVRRVAAP